MNANHAQGAGLRIRDVAVTLAGASDERGGLLAWAVVDLGCLLIDSVSVRRTIAGELIVAMPATRRDGSRKYPFVTVLDPALRGRIHAAVIAEFARAATRAGRRAGQ